jgi:hypothetical protein
LKKIGATSPRERDVGLRWFGGAGARGDREHYGASRPLPTCAIAGFPQFSSTAPFGVTDTGPCRGTDENKGKRYAATQNALAALASGDGDRPTRGKLSQRVGKSRNRVGDGIIGQRLTSTARMCRGPASFARRFAVARRKCGLPASARVPGNRLAARALTLWPATSC